MSSPIAAPTEALFPTRTAATFPPPIPEAQGWLARTTLPEGLPLINVSQAAPADPPPEALRRALAEAVIQDDGAHLYGPVLGLPDLRAEIAAQWSSSYGGAITPEAVAVTSGCNMAFCAILPALTTEGDEVLLPTPWYFNHKMWLDMTGVKAVAVPTGADLLPDPAEVARRITPRTRAIVAVTPNNPAGVEYPAGLMSALLDVAEAHGIKLIVDETYRDFHSQTGAPHDLFKRDGWEKTLIHLYSFSKAYRLTGHRVGAVIANPALLHEVEKWMDTVAICANQLGQRAALWGLRNLRQWLAGERDEILDRRAAIHDHMGLITPQGWRLRGCGAYFAYLEHPFEMGAGDLAEQMVSTSGILALPASMFTPPDDPSGSRHLRVAFANIDRDGIAQLFTRLGDLPFPLAPAPGAD